MPMSDAPARSPRRLFEVVGIELEYMIVDRGTLSVRPIADQLLRAAAERQGAVLSPEEFPEDVDFGDIAWSNELQAHVIEMKTSEPIAIADLDRSARAFQESVGVANELLAPMGAALLPSGMHPLMDPHRELVLWPHANHEVYEAFNRIFDCRGHGWANLQSVHVNLPFWGDEEFGRLHAAIRVLLPILPALAASSPFVEGQATSFLDTRLEVYRTNSEAIPSITGHVIPEPVFTEAAYTREILERIRRDVAPHNAGGVLQPEWVNARGCIARFDRGSIEIRVLDVQENPAADIAVCGAIIAVLRALAGGSFASGEVLRSFSAEDLARVFLVAVRDAEEARIDDARYLDAFGWRRGACRAGDLWAHLLSHPDVRDQSDAMASLPTTPSLARRLLRAAGPSARREEIAAVYRRLLGSLSEGRPFTAPIHR